MEAVSIPGWQPNTAALPERAVARRRNRRWRCDECAHSIGAIADRAVQISRDFGQGLITSRPGPARGTVRSPLGLAIRLNRAQVISWACAFAGLGIVFGYFTGSVRDLFRANPAMTEVFAAGASPADPIAAFITTILSLIGIWWPLLVGVAFTIVPAGIGFDGK